MQKKITCIFITILFLCSGLSVSYAESPYLWYTFNIPPFGSESERGIGYVLANAYINAGFKNKVILTTPARWFNDMQNSKNNEFCSTGSWKLPKTGHRVYSDSIMNTVDYGIAVRPDMYAYLSNNGESRVTSIIKVIAGSKSFGRMVIMNGRPVFGKMNTLLEKGRAELDTHIDYITASEGAITLLKMADVKSRDVGSVLLFPEEYQVFNKAYPDHSLEYLMLSEGTSFAPIRASCPDTPDGRLIITEINKLLNDGLRAEVYKLFLEALPNIKEIEIQAKINQQCIKDSSCKDPLTDIESRRNTDVDK